MHGEVIVYYSTQKLFIEVQLRCHTRLCLHLESSNVTSYYKQAVQNSLNVSILLSSMVPPTMPPLASRLEPPSPKPMNMFLCPVLPMDSRPSDLKFLVSHLKTVQFIEQLFSLTIDNVWCQTCSNNDIPSIPTTKVLYIYIEFVTSY